VIENDDKLAIECIKKRSHGALCEGCGAYSFGEAIWGSIEFSSCRKPQDLAAT
jgi:hypothetical protein